MPLQNGDTNMTTANCTTRIVIEEGYPEHNRVYYDHDTYLNIS